jgi:hypothetical protein
MLPENCDHEAMLIVTLVRDDGPTEEIDEFRTAMRDSLDATARANIRTFEVVPSDVGPWSAGGIDLVRCRGPEDMATSAARATAVRRVHALPGTSSCRIYATRVFPLTPPPASGVHLFAQGHYLPGYTRQSGQARWRQHAGLLASLPWFTEQLLGYEQYHGYEAESAARLGVDDTNGFMHLAHPSVEARDHALQLPERTEVLVPDERVFMATDRGMRVLVVETTGAAGTPEPGLAD